MHSEVRTNFILSSFDPHSEGKINATKRGETKVKHNFVVSFLFKQLRRWLCRLKKAFVGCKMTKSEPMLMASLFYFLK